VPSAVAPPHRAAVGGAALRLLLLTAGLAEAGCAVDELGVLGAGGFDEDDGGPGQGDQDASGLIVPERGPYHVYLFDEGAGDTVRDRAGRGDPLDLVIDDPAQVLWTDAGALRIVGPARLTSDRAPLDLLDAAEVTDALSVEAWVVPSEGVVTGTHRIVSVSETPQERNFTLGQGDREARGPTGAFTFRLRTTGTGDNGLPAATSGDDLVAAGRLTHLVGVRDRERQETLLYVDGSVRARNERRGALDVFDRRYPLVMGDELEVDGDERAWLGELHHVALWARALSPDEVAARFARGPD
jgi:hypothetical protein